MRPAAEAEAGMGACNSSPEEEAARRKNSEINKRLQRDRREQAVKLLLLGTGQTTTAFIY